MAWGTLSNPVCREILGCSTTRLRPATIQHFHAVQAGNQGLSYSWAKTELRPSTPTPTTPLRYRRSRSEKKISRYNPLLSTSSCISYLVQIHTHNWRKGPGENIKGKKAGYGYGLREGQEGFRSDKKGKAVNRLPGILVNIWTYNYLYVRGGLG